MEVARALVLPDFSGPSLSDLMSLLLVWEEVELDLRVVKDEQGAGITEVYQRLVEEGLVSCTVRPFDSEQVEVQDSSPSANASGPEFPDSIPKSIIPELMLIVFDDWVAQGKIEQIISHGGRGAAKTFIRNLREAYTEAGRRGLAPVAVTPFASAASALPAANENAAITEATMIQVACKGIRVSNDTTIDELLRFRERNFRLMGRFRGALIDLAASVESTSPVSAAEQAHAILLNRIEPGLGDLLDAMGKGRIRFAVETLLGATSIAAGVGAGLGAAAGGQVVTQALRYAFDRDQLIREHPYGLIYRATDAFGDPTDVDRPRATIDDPETYIATTLEKMLRAASDVAIKSMRDRFRREAEEAKSAPEPPG